MEPIAENFFIDAYNKIDLSIKKYSKWATAHPAYFDRTTVDLLKKQSTDKQNLTVILENVSNSLVTERKRLSAIRQIDTILGELEQSDGGCVTPNQGLMLDDYLYKMIANLLADIVYKRQFFNSNPKLRRSLYTQVDFGPLCKNLRSMKHWLIENHNLNYVDFERYMDGHLTRIANMSSSPLAA